MALKLLRGEHKLHHYDVRFMPLQTREGRRVIFLYK